MWRIAPRIALLSALAAAGYASLWTGFATAPLDRRGSNATADRSMADASRPARVGLADADLVQTHARPLFSLHRRPFVPRPAVVEQAVAQVEQPAVEQSVSLPRRLALLGTNVAGPVASALVRNKESDEIRWLTIGEVFDGWILSSASADHAAFVCRERQGNDCEYRLTLYSDTGDP